MRSVRLSRLGRPAPKSCSLCNRRARTGTSSREFSIPTRTYSEGFERIAAERGRTATNRLWSSAGLNKSNRMSFAESHDVESRVGWEGQDAYLADGALPAAVRYVVASRVHQPFEVQAVVVETTRHAGRIHGFEAEANASTARGAARLCLGHQARSQRNRLRSSSESG